MFKEINTDIINELESRRDSSAHRVLISNALRQNGIEQVAFNKKAADELYHTFSIELPFSKITNQEKSGRCWLFAALNTVRQKFINEYNLEDFEFSQSWLMFWDKLEKCNYYLEAVIKLSDRELDDRTLFTLMSDPIQDGGHWDMYVSLIEKYGIVPKYVFPESFNSSNTKSLNECLSIKLRQSTALLRRLIKSGMTHEQVYKKKTKCMSDIYNMLVYAIGEPVNTFDLEFTDKNKQYSIFKNLTPKEFYKDFLKCELSKYVSLINAPTDDKPFNQTYTIEFLGNVVGGREIKYLNIEIEKLVEYARFQLENQEPVWFGCDMGKFVDRQKGLMHSDLYDFNEAMATCLDLDKGKRLQYCHSKMTHAMVFIGANIKEDNVEKWKVENSWGDEVGKEGVFIMNSEWFLDNVFQVVINKDYLTEEDKKNFNKEPIVLPIWDPMGSLARL
jgi:bleomycin hydrolase